MPQKRHRGVKGAAVRSLDISMPLFEGMPAFPGDPPFSSEAVLRPERGDAYFLSRIALGTHAGTHIDPPSHFLAGAPSVDQLDLETLQGPCRVLEARPEGRTIGPEVFDRLPKGTTRLLLRTPNSERWARRLEFFGDFVGLGERAATRLVELGVRLVGIDSLSIETDLTGAYPVHRELLGHGVVIVEGLLLAGAPPGAYELSCLPLAVRNGDGGPARAVLRSA